MSAIDDLLSFNGPPLRSARGRNLTGFDKRGTYTGVHLLALRDEIDALIVERDALKADAARYTWLKVRLASAEFNYGEDERTVLVFDMPSLLRIGANIDATIDEAMAPPPEPTP